MADTKPVAQPLRITESDFHFSEATPYGPRASVTLRAGVAFEECLNPEAWVSIAPKFEANKIDGRAERLGTIIAVRTEDHAFYAELYVRALAGKGLVVQPITGPVMLGVDSVKAGGYDVRWNLGKRRFEVVNRRTHAVDHEARTKEEVQEWIDGTSQALKVA